MKHGSLFTGVGGLDLGFEAAGIETLWQCEINKQARSVLAKHWPNVKRYEDVSTVCGADVAPVDIISFGSPCQDLSVAGKRAGFQDGTRSNLYFEAIRIIKEMREKTNGQYPRYAVWENVRGALSSNGGADFLAAVEALAELGALDISWRLVNTCHFGPPQRRVRVFLVADFGGERAGEILAESARVCWHPAQIGEAGQETAGETEEGPGSGGWTAARSTSSTIQAGGGERGYRVDAEGAAGGQVVYKDISNCLSARNQRIDYETETFVVYQYGGYNQKLEEDGTHRTLRTGKDSGDFVAVPASAVLRMRSGKPGGGKGALVKEDMSLTLATANDQTLFEPMIASQPQAYVKSRRASSVEDYETWKENEVAPTLNVFDNVSETRATAVSVENEPVYRVRRLTPRECERLQGWPDDHTRWADTGKEVSDSARYKMCGNGISAPVAQWLGENIMKGHTK